jgi:hypothetical protein
MSAQSPEIQLKIAEWRAKARAGTLTQDEQREAIAALRADRGQIAQATGGSRTTKSAAAKAKKPDGDALLNELEGL